MSAGETRNIVASVLAKLRNHSKASGAPFQQVLQQYAIERFLHRISKSTHAQSVILKGALLLKTIGIPNARPTMDIDMLHKGIADQAILAALVKDCATSKQRLPRPRRNTPTALESRRRVGKRVSATPEDGDHYRSPTPIQLL